MTERVISQEGLSKETTKEAAKEVLSKETAKEKEARWQQKAEEVANLIAKKLGMSVRRTGDGWLISQGQSPSLEVGRYGDGTPEWEGWFGIVPRQGSTIYAAESYPPQFSAPEIAEAASFLILNPKIAHPIREGLFRKAVEREKRTQNKTSKPQEKNT
jgi:hypothetical protein